MKTWLFLAVLVILMPRVEAVSLVNTTLAASTSGTNVTFSTPVSADQVMIESTYITLWNATVTNSIGRITCAVLNFSASNTTDSASFPAFSATTSQSRNITSGINQTCAATINTTVAGNISPSLRYANASTLTPSYSTDGLGNLTLNITDLPVGISVLALDGVGPVLGNVSLLASNVYPGGVLPLRVDALDEGNTTPVAGVFVNVSIGGVTYTVPLSLVGGSTYEGSFGNTSDTGVYRLLFWANDTYGNIGTLDAGSFAVAEPTSGGSSGGGSGGGSSTGGSTGGSSTGASGGANLTLNASANPGAGGNASANTSSDGSATPVDTASGTVVVAGDRDAFIFGGIVLVGVVLMVLGLRGGKKE